MFIYSIYNHNWRNISTVYITRLASNEIFSPSNKMNRDVGRAKDLTAPRYFAMFVMLLWMLSNVHSVPCVLCNTEVLFYVAGSGRERSDSVPSRTRTISDGSHPLTHPHSSRSLVPNSGSSRPHSVCWPAGSPVRWVPLHCAHAVCSLV